MKSIFSKSSNLSLFNHIMRLAMTCALCFITVTALAGGGGGNNDTWEARFYVNNVQIQPTSTGSGKVYFEDVSAGLTLDTQYGGKQQIDLKPGEKNNQYFHVFNTSVTPNESQQIKGTFRAEANSGSFFDGWTYESPIVLSKNKSNHTVDDKHVNTYTPTISGSKGILLGQDVPSGNLLAVAVEDQIGLPAEGILAGGAQPGQLDVNVAAVQDQLAAFLGPVVYKDAGVGVQTVRQIYGDVIPQILGRGQHRLALGAVGVGLDEVVAVAVGGFQVHGGGVTGTVPGAGDVLHLGAVEPHGQSALVAFLPVVGDTGEANGSAFAISPGGGGQRPAGEACDHILGTAHPVIQIGDLGLQGGVGISQGVQLHPVSGAGA